MRRNIIHKQIRDFKTEIIVLQLIKFKKRFEIFAA